MSLSSYIVDHLIDQRRQGDDILVIYYFFTSLRLDSLSPINFLRSILHQILSPEMLSPSLQREIEELFPSLSYPSEPDINALESLIFRQWGKPAVKQTFLIVDGLDEVNADVQKVILRILMDLYRKHPKSFKIHTSAQPEVDLGSPFRNDSTITTLYIQGHDMQADIDIYLETKGDGFLTDKLQDPDLVSVVRSVLSSRSEGM